MSTLSTIRTALDLPADADPMTVLARVTELSLARDLAAIEAAIGGLTADADGNVPAAAVDAVRARIAAFRTRRAEVKAGDAVDALIWSGRVQASADIRAALVSRYLDDPEAIAREFKLIETSSAARLQ